VLYQSKAAEKAAAEKARTIQMMLDQVTSELDVSSTVVSEWSQITAVLLVSFYTQPTRMVTLRARIVGVKIRFIVSVRLSVCYAVDVYGMNVVYVPSNIYYVGCRNPIEY